MYICRVNQSIINLIMRKTFLLIIAFVTVITAPCQNSAAKERLLREIAEAEAEIERMQKASASEERPEGKYCFEKAVYQQQKPMTDREFEQFCKANIPSFNASAAGSNYLITSSCIQTPAGVHASYCVSVVPDVVSPKTALDPVSREFELQKIRNTKAMYTDLINSLKNELKSNGIDIVDQSTNLVVKHLEIKGVAGNALKSKLKELKDNMMLSLRRRFGLSENGIENENAQLVDDITNQAEGLMTLIPGASLVTCHYLWRILKSTPEAGIAIGDAAAAVNIYFQIDEFSRKLEQLDAEEARLSSMN